MKSFSSRPTSGRRLYAPGAAARPRDLATELRSAPRLEAQPGPVAVPGASRRPRLGMTLSALLVSALLFIVGAPSSVADPSPAPDLAQSVAAHE